MSRVISTISRHTPIHRRPLVLAMVMPLAATCLLGPSGAESLRGTSVSQQILRLENLSTLQERQRRLCDLPAGERFLDDPPAGIARSGEQDNRSPAEIAAVDAITSNRFAANERCELFPPLRISCPSLSAKTSEAPRGPPRPAYIS